MPKVVLSMFSPATADGLDIQIAKGLKLKSNVA
jgi:hypothetical protein